MKSAPLCYGVTLLLLSGAARGSDVPTHTAAFPGDLGRPFDGLPITSKPVEGHMPWPSMPGPSRGPTMDLALQIAKGAAAACKGEMIGISVIDSAALPKLYYVTDGAAGYHAYTAFRKAYTALTFKMPTSAMGRHIRTDPALAARITANTNLLAFPGGLPILAGTTVIGAVGVSGVQPHPGDKIDPGSADEKCAKAGLDKVRDLVR